MSEPVVTAILLVCVAVLGVSVGVLMVRLVRLSARLELERVQRAADADAAESRSVVAAQEMQAQNEARRRELQAAAAAEREELRALRSTQEKREQRLAEREDRLLAERQSLERAQTQVQADRASLDRQLAGLRRDELAVHDRLMEVAGLTAEQAQARLMSLVEHETKLQAASLAREIENNAKRDADRRARTIIATAIQRLAADQTSESVVATVDLPSDDMKGRIIGREGRNIRSFEQVTGVNVMIDDTPGSVLISCFDPVRRETARVTLQELVADGRIHPARIEEVYQRSKAKVDERCRRAAEDALLEVGISDIHPGLIPMIGGLAYRTSYGQNVLRHLVECGHLAGMMAAELGLAPQTCIRAAFLHDIGKAVTHEAEGSHAAVGAQMAAKHGESADIVNAIAAHHNEVEPATIEAVLTQAADAISGSRPGARRESLEAYVHRLERLEEVAGAHPGVERVFAMQAGREVRVMVAPQQVDDGQALALAREIARQVHDELTYPGQIRITVVRESRATEVAH